MLSRIDIPSLIVLPAEVGAGKTVVAGAIADWFRRRGSRVAVCVPMTTGAPRRREGLVSEDAEFLAACADARHPLDLIGPLRWAEDLIPPVAARREDRAVEWDSIERSIRLMSRDSDVMIVQAPAPMMTPVDETHTVLDVVTALGAPVVIVSRPSLRQVHPVSITAKVLRDSGAPKVAGVVINRYPADTPTVDQESSLREIEKWSQASLLCVVPEEKRLGPELTEGITGVMDLVDWITLARTGSGERAR